MSEKKRRRSRKDGSESGITPTDRKQDQLQVEEEEGSEQFIEAKQVPKSRTPKHAGNLTGTARKVKDCCADLYNLVEKWDRTSATGMELVCAVANMKLRSFKEDVAEPSTASVEELQCSIDKLEKVYKSLETIVLKMENVARSLKGVSDLEWHQNKQTFPKDPLFLTWSTSQFYEMADQFVEMYRKELHLRKTIIENIAHTDNRDLMMCYSSSWTHRPYIDSNISRLLESALIETGHR